MKTSLMSLLLVLSAPASAADWIQIRDDEAVTAYYDRASIITYDNFFKKAWSRFVYKNNPNFHSRIDLLVFDCGLRQFSIRTTYLYPASPMNGEKGVPTLHEFNNPPKEIVPDSVFEDLYHAVC